MKKCLQAEKEGEGHVVVVIGGGNDGGGDERSDSGGSSIFSTPQSTPIADYFRGRTTSLFLPDTPGDLVLPQPQRLRSASQVSDTPSIDIEVMETQQDDWTQSVLLAAQASQRPQA